MVTPKVREYLRYDTEKRVVDGVELNARATYWREEPTVLEAMVNGCGPGGLGDFLVPDTMYGLSVKPACRIHDYDYAVGRDGLDKEIGDSRFHDNLIAIIDAKTSTGIRRGFGLLRRLRKNRAYVYYMGVAHGGDMFFEGASIGAEG